MGRGMGIERLQDCGQCAVVAEATEPRDHRLGDVRDVTVMPKRFAGIYVGDMHFDTWNIDPSQGIAQRDAGMGKRRRIDNDELRAIGTRLMNRLDHLLFTVALQTGKARTRTLRLGLQAMIYLVQRFRTVNLGLAGTQQVEVGSV